MKTTRIGWLAVCAFLSISALADSADWRPSVRWRGFNLLEMFIKHHDDMKPKEFREEDFQMIKDWGFNFVRLPMDYRFWIKNNDWEQFDEDALAVIDRAVALGRKYGVHVHLCMHRAPGYTVARPKEKTNLFTDPEPQRVCAKHWAMFARRYRGIPNEQLSFNLFNEPPNVSDEAYGKVGRKLIAAIRKEDPTRFILADGLSWGNHPAKSLMGIPGVGQSTRGYQPMGVTHYRASWAGNPTATPVWPIPLDQPNGLFAGTGKASMRLPFELLELPPCKIKATYGRVSGPVTMRFTADGAQVCEQSLEPKTDSPLWRDAKYHPEWNITQGNYLGETSLELPKGAKRLEVLLSKGDWAYLRELVVSSLDGKRSVTLPFGNDWNRPVNFTQKFLGFQSAKPFASLSSRPSRYSDAGMEYLYVKLLKEWDDARAQGMFAMAGEFGCYKYTPHELVLDWLEDYLRLWKERNMGWAMWNLRGEFGILDSNRADVKYEDFRGHKLDRQMLDLLLKY